VTSTDVTAARTDRAAASRDAEDVRDAFEAADSISREAPGNFRRTLANTQSMVSD
jgi:hypothetical protein